MSTNRSPITCALTAAVLCIALGRNAIYAQSQSVAAESQTVPPATEYIVAPDPLFGDGIEYVGDTSPYLARGTIKGCETCSDRQGWTCCCLVNWLTYPFCCGGDGEACACPWHHWCPRGHCKVRPTGCTRIDYSRHVLKGRHYKKSTVAAESTAKVDPIGVSYYNEYEPCCQDFWLRDGRLKGRDCCDCCDF